MSNPKAPRVRRPYAGGPLIPIGDDGPAPEPTIELPADRMRRLGADDDVVGYFAEVWEHLDEAARAEWLVDMDVSTDAELRDELADIDLGSLPDAPSFAGEVNTAVADGQLEARSDAELIPGTVEQRPDGAEPGTSEPTADAVTGEPLAPVVDGRVQHEGGGYYSVWIGDDQVTVDNIRGRDEAEAFLQGELANRFGPLEGDEPTGD